MKTYDVLVLLLFSVSYVFAGGAGGGRPVPFGAVASPSDTSPFIPPGLQRPDAPFTPPSAGIPFSSPGSTNSVPPGLLGPNAPSFPPPVSGNSNAAAGNSGANANPGSPPGQVTNNGVRAGGPATLPPGLSGPNAPIVPVGNGQGTPPFPGNP